MFRPTLKELIEELQKLEREGHGDAEVLVRVDMFHAAMIDEAPSFDEKLGEVWISARGL